MLLPTFLEKGKVFAFPEAVFPEKVEVGSLIGSLVMLRLLADRTLKLQRHSFNFVWQLLEGHYKVVAVRLRHVDCLFLVWNRTFTFNVNFSRSPHSLKLELVRL